MSSFMNINFAHLDPNGGFSAVTSCTEDAVLETFELPASAIDINANLRCVFQPCPCWSASFFSSAAAILMIAVMVMMNGRNERKVTWAVKY